MPAPTPRASPVGVWWLSYIVGFLPVAVIRVRFLRLKSIPEALQPCLKSWVLSLSSEHVCQGDQVAGAQPHCGVQVLGPIAGSPAVGAFAELAERRDYCL